MTRASKVLYLFVPGRTFQWNENGMDGLVKEVIPLLQYLIPGFLATWIFYSLTAFKRPDAFGQIVQALIFTFVIQSLVMGLESVLLLMGERLFSIGSWNQKTETLWSAVIAVLLGLMCCHITNSDKLHGVLRLLGITTQKSFPCQWYSVFSSKPGFVMLHLVGGKRLFGWPREWPSEPSNGQFVLEFPRWLNSAGVPLPERPSAAVVDVSKIHWVEFVDTTG